MKRKEKHCSGSSGAATTVADDEERYSGIKGNGKIQRTGTGIETDKSDPIQALFTLLSAEMDKASQYREEGTDAICQVSKSKSVNDVRVGLGDNKALLGLDELMSESNEETGNEEKLGKNEDSNYFIQLINSLSLEMNKTRCSREQNMNNALFKPSGSTMDEETHSGDTVTSCNEEKQRKGEGEPDVTHHFSRSINRLSEEMDEAYRENDIEKLFKTSKSLIDMALEDNKALKNELGDLKKNEDSAPASASLQSDLLLEEVRSGRQACLLPV